MSSSRAKKPAVQEDESNSILARLAAELTQSERNEELGTDVTILFCGSKKSGKTSLIDRYINPTKDEKDVPKSTVALDYKFARYAASDASTSPKVLAHIYDLSGEGNEDVISIPVSPASSSNLVVAITVDLSEPHGALPSLERWLQQLQAQAIKSLDALSKESSAGAKRVEAIKATRGETLEGSGDAAQLKPFPVPLVIFGTKWDVFASSDATPEKRKSMCRALRYFAHANGGSLVFTSLKDKTSMNNMRNVLRLLLFGVQPSKGVAEQLEPTKPICVLAGKDSMQSIGAPRSGQANAKVWADTISIEFPDPHPSSVKGGKKDDGEQVSEDLQKFSESGVDGIVEQRVEELQQYRRQVERNQRLASEGVDGARAGGILAS